MGYPLPAWVRVWEKTFTHARIWVNWRVKYFLVGKVRVTHTLPIAIPNFDILSSV